MRRASDRLYARSLGPRERQAIAWIAAHPGASVEQLEVALGVGRKRVWQIVSKLELAGAIRRDGGLPMRRGPRRSS